MTPLKRKSNGWLLAGVVVLLDALLVVGVKLWGDWMGGTGAGVGTGDLVVWGLRGLVIFTFAMLAWREVGLLFLSPARNMGTGWARVWAVARTTVFEAWAARVWLLPVLWLGASLLMILAVRPFDESERIPLYTKTLLSTQEVLLLVMMWVMACVSMPRERERRVLMTNASKPLSRLEMVLGKVTGFGVVSALLLLVMGVMSLAVLHISDLRLRSRAQQAYDLQVADFNKNVVAPSLGLKQLAEQGSMFAYNYFTVPPDGLNLGFFDPRRDDAGNLVILRGLIGGTSERAVYRFGPRLEIPDASALLPAGARPYFEFHFPVRQADARFPMPARVKINVTASATGPMAPQEKELTLDSEGTAYWEPDRPEDLFTTYDARTLNLIQDRGPVTLEVSCPTPGVLLQVLDGADPDAKGALPPGTEANAVFIVRLDRYYPGLGMQPSTSFPMARPNIRGFERRDRQSIAAATDAKPFNELAVYRFPAALVRKVPIDSDGTFKLSLLLETYKLDNPQDATNVDISVLSLNRTGVPTFHERRQVDEKRLTTISVPAENLGDKDPDKRGDMIVVLTCATPGHSITLVEDSVRIELAQTPFFLNLFKSELVILMEAILIILLSVTCSVRLGWPVAMTLSGLGYLFGHLVEFLAGLSEYGGLGALNYHFAGRETLLFSFFDSATSILWKFLGFISILVPNFNLYQPQEYIGNLQNMPWSVLSTDLFNTAIYSLPFIAIAYLLFRKQEIG